MKEDGKQLKDKQTEIGASTIEVAVAADLHPQTVYRVYCGEKVSRSTLNRVRKALAELQDKAGLKTKSAG